MLETAAWDETKVLDEASTLLTEEALYIQLSELQLFNRDEGIAIPECSLLGMSHAAETMSPTHAKADWWLYNV